MSATYPFTAHHNLSAAAPAFRPVDAVDAVERDLIIRARRLQMELIEPPTVGGHANPGSDSDPLNTTIFIGGLPEGMSEGTVRRVCEVIGEVTRVRVQGRNAPAWMAFVTFRAKAAAQRAIDRLQGLRVEGHGPWRLAWPQPKSPRATSEPIPTSPQATEEVTAMLRGAIMPHRAGVIAELLSSTPMCVLQQALAKLAQNQRIIGRKPARSDPASNTPSVFTPSPVTSDSSLPTVASSQQITAREPARSPESDPAPTTPSGFTLSPVMSDSSLPDVGSSQRSSPPLGICPSIWTVGPEDGVDSYAAWTWQDMQAVQPTTIGLGLSGMNL